jgi:hypothetical protein
VRIILLGTLLTFGISASAQSLRGSEEVIFLKTNPQAIQLSLKVVQSAKSNWTRESLLNELNKANVVYSKCGVAFEKIDILIANEAPVAFDWADVHEFAAALTKMGFRSQKEPTLILAGSIKGELLRKAKTTGGFAFHRGIIATTLGLADTPLENVAFALDRTLSPEYKIVRNPDYSALAHELAHVFLNTEHVDFPNLLSKSYRQVNGDLTPAQCQTLRSSSLLTQSIIDQKKI